MEYKRGCIWGRKERKEKTNTAVSHSGTSVALKRLAGRLLRTTAVGGFFETITEVSTAQDKHSTRTKGLRLEKKMSMLCLVFNLIAIEALMLTALFVFFFIY